MKCVQPAGSGWAARAMLAAAVAVMPGVLFAQAVPAGPPAAPSGIFPLRGGYLGVGLQEVTPERAKALKLREEAGVEITSVVHDSPADKAGLKPGDVITAYNGQRIEGFAQFSRMVGETPVGREVKLDIVRNGAAQTVLVRIETRPVPGFFPDGVPRFNPPQIPMPDIPRVFQGMHSPMLGIEAESIDGQLAQYFGVKDSGVLVRSVLKNSAAEKAGLKAGDVILRIDDIKVASAADISARLRAAQGKSVTLTVMREHKEMSLPVTPDTGERAGAPQR